MQKITGMIHGCNNKGQKDIPINIIVDETIGLNVGSDIYATARGTVKNLVKRSSIILPWINADFKINDEVIIHLSIVDHVWYCETVKIS